MLESSKQVLAVSEECVIPSGVAARLSFGGGVAAHRIAADYKVTD